MVSIVQTSLLCSCNAYATDDVLCGKVKKNIFGTFEIIKFYFQTKDIDVLFFKMSPKPYFHRSVRLLFSDSKELL